MTYRTCKPPSQSVYSGVCHRLALTSKIAIGFRSGVRHRLTLMSKINIRLTMSRPLIYTIILTNMSYKRKRKTYFGFIHYKKTVQKPATSTTTADRTSQRPITKERPSTVQRVPLQNTRSRPPIKTATIKKVGKKP